MDLIADSDTPTTYTTVGGLALVQEPSLSSAHCQTESEGTILLQLLEFKTHLLEVVEELHIQKDAEKRFEDQISKLVLDKQELEWEKESVQHQIETVANQHAETLSNVKNQLQAKIRNIEEEKGNYQVSVELKDKEINNLKEELRSLQLLKYNLEKKSNELEQKLALQSRSKDSHLNQLGEVEKRFSALSRQCAMVKQAHEKLEQNVDEAMRINMKLTSANETQEATIVALKKELGEVNNKLIKAKITSVRHDKISHTGNEQHIQKLHQKLNMETEMNKKLHEENVAVRAEKKEVMRSLQQTQQLLLSQTQTLNRTELELQTQREQYQALKQEHQVMRDKRKPLDDKVAKLMETYAAFKTSWDKEKKIFLDCIKSEQQNLQTVKEAYNELRQKQTELSSVAKAQEQHISEIEIRNSNHSRGVSTQDFDHNGPMSSAELPGSGCLQPLASSQTKNPDCLEDAGDVTKLLATGTTGGQEALNHHQQFQFKQPLNPTNVCTLPFFTNNLFSPSSQSGTTSNNTHIMNKYIKNYKTNEGDPDVVSDSRPNCRSINGCGGLLSKEKNEEGNRRMNERKHEEKDDGGQEKKNSKEEGRNTEQQWNREEVQVEDVRERGSTGEKRGTVTAQTKDTAERREDSQGSAEDVRDARNPETEKRERADGQGTDGAEERGTTAHTSETPESQTLTQTTTDWNINKSNTRQVIDFLDTEAPLAECQPSDCSQSHSQKVIEEDPDSIHLNKGCGIGREGQLLNTLNSDHSQSVNHEHNPVIQVQSLCDDEVQTQDAETLSQLPSQRKVSEKTGGEEKPTDKSAADIPTDPSEPLSQSSRSSQTYTVPLAAQTDGIVGIQDFERTTSQTVTSNPTDITSNMKQTDKVCDINVTGECVIGTTRGEPQPLPQSQEILEQENEHLKSLVTDDDGGDSSAYRKSRGQPRQDTQENYDCKTLQDPKEKSKLKDVCVDIIMDTVDLESEVESGSCQDHMKNDKIENTRDAKATKRETDLKASVRLSGPRSSFDSVSVLHQSVQGYEQNTSGSGGRLRHPPSTIPMFGKSKLRKVPLVITRASDQLNASSVSGNAASSTRHQQGESRALADTCRETTAADMESRASLSISCFPVSAFSSAVNILSLQATPGCSTAPASTAGCTSESEWEPYCSQEGEDQQPSFRAQICKIEQFLNEEGLCLPKRRRTDN